MGIHFQPPFSFFCPRLLWLNRQRLKVTRNYIIFISYITSLWEVLCFVTQCKQELPEKGIGYYYISIENMQSLHNCCYVLRGGKGRTSLSDNQLYHAEE